jgi:hypothetical protein
MQDYATSSYKIPFGSSVGFLFSISTATFCSNNFCPLPANITSIIALLSGAIVPLFGLILHCPILSPASYFPPFPPFFASFFTYLAYFFPPFLGSTTGAVILFAA